jgi:hypothetical protein
MKGNWIGGACDSVIRLRDTQEHSYTAGQSERMKIALKTYLFLGGLLKEIRNWYEGCDFV